MTKDTSIPTFSLYGDNVSDFDALVQPSLALRAWGEVSEKERNIAFQQLVNTGWMDRSGEILATISYLNDKYLRACPGKHLHAIPPERHPHSSDGKRRQAATTDFYRIFMEESDPLVLKMISKLAQCLIGQYELQHAAKSADVDVRNKKIEEAFSNFDRFSNCINHLFEQFSVNQLLTRSGFIPRQDAAINSALYIPTLQALADPKWVPVNHILASMFEDYRDGHFAEVITKAHSAVHSFLQVAVGEPGQNAKGEVGKLFKEAKARGLVPSNRFTEPYLGSIQSFLTSERATNSTAKPALGPTSNSDALFMMNMTLLFLQYCLQSR